MTTPGPFDRTHRHPYPDRWMHMGARVYNDAAINVSSNTQTALTFNQERYDIGGFHSTSSNTGRLTAPVAGVYGISGHVRFVSAADYTRIQVFLTLNGTDTIAGINDFLAFGTGGVLRSVETFYALAAGDYVALEVLQVNTAAAVLTITATPAISPEFAIVYLGDTV